MPLNECEVCGAETDAVLCGGCATKLQGRLGHVPSLVEELEVTITKQDRRGARGGGGRPSEPPSPFNERASDTRADLRDILVGWARDVAERSGARLELPYRARAATDAAAWLRDHLRAVAHHPAAGDLFAEVSEVVRAAFQVIDRPPDSVFAGRCDCGGLLYARFGAELATCYEAGCPLVYGVDECREWMRQSPLWLGYQGTADDVACVLSWAGIRVPAGTLRSWRSVGTLPRGGKYRVEDVVAALAARAA